MEEFIMNDFIEQSEFPLLKNKSKKLQAIFKEYLFEDLVKAIFCINSWRDNRSVFESCSAMNMALDNHLGKGGKRIITYEDLLEFYNKIKDILKPTMTDDLTLSDFGEVKIKYKNKYYKILIGTGYEANYAAISCLSEICKILKLEKEYEELLVYISNIISILEKYNISQHSEIDKYFDIPTNEYFNEVYKLFSNDFMIKNKNIIDILGNTSLKISKRHFIYKNDKVYPIFNASILVDYNSALVKKLNNLDLNRVVSNTITNLLHNNFNSYNKNNDVFYPVSIGENHKLTSTRPYTFLAKGKKGFILAINKDEYKDDELQKEISKIRELHNFDKLNIVEIIPVDGDQYKGYHIPKDYNLDIIVYDTHIDVTESRFIGLTGEDDYFFYGGLDIINITYILENFEELEEYLNFKKQDTSKILGIGSSINHFIFWKQNSKTIEKGAVHFSLVNVDYGMADNFIYDYYNQVHDFPYNIPNDFMNNPFSWKIKEYEDGFKEYQAKHIEGFWGYGKPSNTNFLFFAHNLIFHDIEDLSMENKEKIYLMDGLNAKLLSKYENALEKLFSNKILYLLYMPEIYAKKVDKVGFTYQERKYVKSDLLKTDSTIQIRYTVKLDELLKDIINAKDKSVEIDYFLELLLPLKNLYHEQFNELEKILIKDKNALKTVDVFQMELKYYYKDIQQIFRIRPEYFIKAKKEIAKLCYDAKIETGQYGKEEADNVFKKIENRLVDFLECKISEFSQKKLTIKVLKLLSNALHLINVNKYRYYNVKNIEENALNQVKEKSMNEREEYKRYSRILYYFLENNLYVSREVEKECSEDDFMIICAYIDWIITLQDNSNACKFTPIDMQIEFDTEYVPNINISEKDIINNENMQKRSYETEDYHINIDAQDKEFLDIAIDAFEKDTGINFHLLREFLTYISIPQANEEFFVEVDSNVFEVNLDTLICEFGKVIEKAYPKKYKRDDISKIINFLTVDNQYLKTIKKTEYKSISFWNREQRDNRIEVKPLIKDKETIIYTPILCHDLNKRWENGFLDFYLPYEINLNKTNEVLRKWKKRYEDLMVDDLVKILSDLNIGKVYSNIYLNILDPSGNSHPKNLGDYDILIIDDVNKIIWNLECKFIHKCGSVFEVSMQQKDFFDDSNKKNRYSYKFKRRIDYLSNKDNYNRIIKHLNLNEGEYKINSILVTNKVFSSLGYDVDYELLSYNEVIDRIKYNYNKQWGEKI